MLNFKICRQCLRNPVYENQLKFKDDLKDWSTGLFYCRVLKSAWLANGPAPDKCPYILEHAISEIKTQGGSDDEKQQMQNKQKVQDKLPQ